MSTPTYQSAAIRASLLATGEGGFLPVSPKIRLSIRRFEESR
ncbi:MAG: hypothetical protein RLZZ444_1448 [Pseudomonadota bacterium]|jgi:hypothetical protein